MSNLVSIIMPTYNHGKYISEAIDSVLKQTYINWELIIVNNFSTDNTSDIIKSYQDQRISEIKFYNDGIIAKARNRGIKSASGKYIALLDSDDLWTSEKLMKQIRILKNHNDIILCSTACRSFPNGFRIPLISGFNKKISLNQLVKKNIVFNSSVIFKKEAVTNIGTFNENISLRTVEDYEFWLRVLLFKNKSIYFINKPFMMYRISSNNASGVGLKIDYQNEIMKMEVLGKNLFTPPKYITFLSYKLSEFTRRSFDYGAIDPTIINKNNLLVKDFFMMKTSKYIKSFLIFFKGTK